MADLEERVAKLEKQVSALTTALHLSLVSAKPASEWLDAKMKEINNG